MRVVMGLSLTAKSAVWALVDTKDGTILADEVVTLDSANAIARAAARSIQPFALQSERDIAGVRNEAGNVMGLMPHPEHAVDPLTGSTDGLRLFESAARVAATA